MTTGRPIYRTLADVEPESVRWLSPGRIPRGKITVVEGDPGMGKTMMLGDLAARLSRGEGFPGDPTLPPADVVILTGEDGVSDTIRPRLEVAGADLTRVHVFEGVLREGETESAIVLPDDVRALEELVVDTKSALVIIDVLSAFLAGTVDAYRDHDIRRALLPLKLMAEATGAAVGIVRHLRKSGGARGIVAGGGSIGIGAAARSVLLVDQDPGDRERRVLASVKCNLRATPPSLSFSVEESKDGVPKVLWLGRSGETADSLAAARAAKDVVAEADNKTDEAVGLLQGWLAGGELEKREVRMIGQQAGFSDRTLERAAHRLGVVRQQRGFGKDKRSWWALPSGNHASTLPHLEHGTIGDDGMIADLQRLTPPDDSAVSESCQPPAHGTIAPAEEEFA